MNFVVESQHREELVREGKIKPVTTWDFLALKNRDADEAEKRRPKQTDLWDSDKDVGRTG